MRIIVAGGDGFCGWPTALYLSKQGHDVAIVDNLVRRQYDKELNSNSITPIASLNERVDKWRELTGKDITVYQGDLNHYDFISIVFQEFQPEAFVHYAEQRSAPYSMIDLEHARYTQANNVLGNLNVLFAIHDYAPDCHLIKLGTMGEYGTPNIDIEEGWLEVEHKGRRDRMLYPKKPGSFYHLTKVHDSHNIEFACRSWGIRATDLNQGVVYGVNTQETAMDPVLYNRFDYDGIFGTVFNRFVVQTANGLPMSVYGKGGQTRGFINIEDTVRCIEIAALNPAERGEFRVFNQMTEQFSVMDMAHKVEKVAKETGLNPVIDHVANPRVEEEEHYFNAVMTELKDLGLDPHYLTDEVTKNLLDLALENKDRAHQEVIMNSPSWK
ncbi:NAD-dependent epimerase/dehydratase family protein [Aerococcus sp. CDC-944-U94]|uniref:NAD-dependent epimerase/dehydratase family protein n=1 Tax=Aerococcus urinae (strain CCUG 59500 / ACS-120-V-Col10a) TaxID=2976812 RepID=UPI00227ABD4A|nr:NAD-dependent epimerase/dehydratase family protein [Aerococcus sp. Group 1]MCY3054844.1 NAD-dependent epimerase/dehydratase family protein [Aerococcus sp. Group 1]MCY3056574.1 NAD-dependent epimerase/dehydratase family protein [Aerococcus sp. Group 1]